MSDALSPARWWRITPIVFVTFSFAYLDRVNYSFAAAGGIGHDLGISSGMASLIGALFFLGYFVGQIPGAVYAERHSPKRVIFWCLFFWGLLSAATGVVSNVPALLVVRFLLGLVEAAVFPALLIFLNNWFAKSERSFANSFVTLSTPVTVLWMSIVSGYLVNAYGWRWMFVLEGVPSTLWAFAWLYLADDKPSQASWLPKHEQQAIEQTIAAEQAGVKAVRNLGEAFRSKAVITMATLYFFWGLALFGFVLWLPTIIKQAGSSMVATGWLSSFPYLVATILMPTLSIVSDRLGDRRSVVLPCIAISGVAYLALYFGGQTQGMLAYLMLCVAGIGPIVALPLFFSIPADILPKTVAGGAVALINSLGALGGFLGTYLVGWLNGLTNNPMSSFLLMGGSLVVAAVMLATLPKKN